jgi:hypothetical protein
MNKSFNLYDSAAIGVSQNKAKVYSQVLLQPGDIMQIGTAFSTCDRVILDIKAIANTKYSPTPNSTKESVRYYLNESNPFDIIIDAVNPLKAASTIRGLISYNRSKNIIEINTGTIFDRGFFNFSVKLYIPSKWYREDLSVNLAPEGSGFFLIASTAALNAAVPGTKRPTSAAERAVPW